MVAHCSAQMEAADHSRAAALPFAPFASSMAESEPAGLEESALGSSDPEIEQEQFEPEEFARQESAPAGPAPAFP